ncbi:MULTISPECIES: helix-turn-helix transcriptional regulator [Haloarcula]|uniref:helix-turn-helix transcriptional regulator n=1 Tax=Haloarcula TaxID=2237 RepID=UPI0023E8EB45|nr:MarR family transcriptional regulator [Halomicroarcula sp. SHR3]
MGASTISSPLDDVEYLSRSHHRVAALDAMAERPRSRAELLSVTAVSDSTLRRTLRAFEERRWVRRRDGQYEATELGTFVATGMTEFLDRLETEQALRDVWGLLPTGTSGFTVWMWSDAVVTTAVSADPYRPVNRFESLLESTSEARVVGAGLAVLEPCMDELCRLATDGTVEIVDTPTVVEQLHRTHAEQVSRITDSEQVAVRTHEDLPPHGFAVFDGRVAVTGCDPESGTVRVIIDADAPTAREWVASRCDAYRGTHPPLASGPAGGR